MDGIIKLFLKSTEPLKGKDSLPITTISPGVPGTYFIDLGRMKGRVNLGANE